ncbi:hypothetical protein ACIGW1_06120 [Streptomyces sp. NPDC053780]|uniref:hypothetical protein n=1 Tax=unclassified Streptomyces TaxID=2593676 RepID=UPI003434D231
MDSNGNDNGGRDGHGHDDGGGEAPRATPHLLVVGATGALLPAVRTATARGATVTALARNASALRDLERGTGGAARPLARDFEAPGLREALSRAARDRPFTGALLYCPLATPATVRTLTEAVPAGRPVVLLLTSAHAAPEGEEGDAGPWDPALLPSGARPAPDCRLLVLGWRTRPEGSRWHTAEEISEAALRALDAAPPGDAVLGRVRPWSTRPSA